MRKRTGLIVGLLLAAVALAAPLPYDNQSLAVYGCCKARKNYWEPWGKRPESFKECEQLNQQVDHGDNVFDEQGYIWWDVGC